MSWRIRWGLYVLVLQDLQGGKYQMLFFFFFYFIYHLHAYISRWLIKQLKREGTSKWWKRNGRFWYLLLPWLCRSTKQAVFSWCCVFESNQTSLFPGALVRIWIAQERHLHPHPRLTDHCRCPSQSLNDCREYGNRNCQASKAFDKHVSEVNVDRFGPCMQSVSMREITIILLHSRRGKTKSFTWKFVEY